MKVRPMATNSIIIESGKLNILIMETSDGRLDVLGEKPIQFIGVKVHHDEGKKQSVNRGKYDYFTADKLEIMGSFEDSKSKNKENNNATD